MEQERLGNTGLACAIVKGGESECFRIDNGVRKGVSCFLGFSVFMIIIWGVSRSRQQSRFQCLYGCSDERDGDGEEGRE